MRIFVWGTGKYAAFFLNHINYADDIAGYVSNMRPSDEFQNRYIREKKVYSVQELPELEFDIIIAAVLSKQHEQEMYNQYADLKMDVSKLVFVSRLWKVTATLTEAEKYIYGMFKQHFVVPESFFDFISHWRQYYYENYIAIPQKVALLNRSLDKTSQETASLLMERNFKIFPLPEHSNLFLWDQQQIMTKDEQQLLASNLDWEARTREEYHIADDLPLEFSVFHFHCGLSFLAKETMDALRGKDFIDGGAFWGDSALVLNEYAPSSIHSFEPFASNYEKLVMNIRDRNLTTIVPVNKGLGTSQLSNVEYFYDQLMDRVEGVVSTASCLPFSESSEDVSKTLIEITSIDEYSAVNGLNVGLIKLDVEGNELATIQGALQTIKASKPVLLISVYHTPEDLLEIKPLIESLDMGYRFLIRHLSYYPNTEIMLIAY